VEGAEEYKQGIYVPGELAAMLAALAFGGGACHG
jgi:hypothetical protein